MTSESQERMLAIVTPDALAQVEEVCRRWEVRATVVGRVTEPPVGEPGRLRILDGFDGEALGDVPAAALSEEAPRYHRAMKSPADYEARAADDPGALDPPVACGDDLLALLADPSWVYRQYDHQLFLNTVGGPGGDAAVLRLAGPGLPPSERGLALTTDSNPTWCSIDPRLGTASTVAEAALNLACAGAAPAAIVNCLNFGNPEHPEVMWQLSEAIDGLSEACLALGLPVIGGNVSFYNESAGADIDPTPVIGGLGLIERLVAPPPGVALREGASLVLLDGGVGASTTAGSTAAPPGRRDSLGGSRWAVCIRGHRNGTLPPLDLEGHARLVEFVATTVGAGLAGGEALVQGIHDVSAGGLGLTLAEFAVRSDIGLRVGGIADHRALFSEAPSRVVVCTASPDELCARAADAGIDATALGSAGGDRIVVDGLVDVSVADAISSWRSKLPDLLDEVAPAVVE
jgi:phosphoribosylformylglycinamidine synthase